MQIRELQTILVVTVMSQVSPAPMDPASSGVWDSPMATDYWVKKFGFMWAGGRSGMYGLEALQKVSSDSELPKFDQSIFNPSGMYGNKVMNPEAPEYNDPSTSKANFNKILDFEPSQKSMKELSPLKVAMPGENKEMSFNR